MAAIDGGRREYVVDFFALDSDGTVLWGRGHSDPGSRELFVGDSELMSTLREFGGVFTVFEREADEGHDVIGLGIAHGDLLWASGFPTRTPTGRREDISVTTLPGAVVATQSGAPGATVVFEPPEGAALRAVPPGTGPWTGRDVKVVSAEIV
ncbi:hypothetical protein AB0I72_17665 [Nocardiopsis sp. NPDC049922]|uniref:hypothetical protein n=1 Tax=Nocardiopsis sp. NPDC049922 TaxID=3155157 RepID=UPI0033F05640